jgi:hypothetical protein
MGKQYYYSPFGESTIHDRALQNALKKYVQKDNCTIIRTDYNAETQTPVWHKNGNDRKPLANIEDDSTLVIEGHGCWTSNLIGVKTKKWKPFSDNTDRGWVQITANDLAKQLKFDGLPTTHQRIRLLSCYGGGLNPKDRVHDRS